MKTKIINAKIVLPSSVMDGVLVTDGGVISYVGECYDGEYDSIYDAEGAYLLPGFIDIHCHGGGGYDFMDATPEQMLKISDFHLSHGTTTLVPTTMTDTWEAITGALDKFASLGEDRGILHGVHLEGPWFSPAQCGAQPTDDMEAPSREKLSELKAKYPFIERVSMAPELDEKFDTGRACAELGMVASVGHTDADFDQTVGAADNGYTLVTHVYSGMKGVVRVNAYRVAGAVEGALYDDRLTVEVIADGKHLPSGLLKLIYKCKGADRICLITDAMRAAGAPDGTESILGKLDGGVAVIVEDGVAKLPDRLSFAGSVSTSDRLFRTMYSLSGASLPEVARMLSATPARVMGYTDRGRLEAGLRADLLLLDGELSVKDVFLGGELVERK
ncbi:MAG: amidohydrolase family protein [Clostridia bacterium]|nr:amidohydrolase family protein [Clostridia bacterium]